MTNCPERRGVNQIRFWFGVLALAILTACGGGGGDAGYAAPPVAPSVAPPLPAAVTATVPAAGGSVAVNLAEGGRATLAYPAQAFAADRPVTVTPLAAAQGEWTRFTIQPGIGQLQAPLVLRVRPPAAIGAAQVPVLQLVTADGPLLLQTKLLPDGQLEATVPPQLAVPATAAAAATPGRARALSTARALADGDAEATTVAGTGFLAVCEVPQATIANARTVILNASSISQVRTAISTLAMMEDRCSTGEALGALDGLAAQLPALYAEALTAWRAVNYLEVETQFETFRRGVRRVMALCAAAGELGSDLVCPLTPDYDSEYTEIADGFAAAANERESTAGLRPLFDALSTLPGEAALFGLPKAEPALRQTVALIADRLMDRAYTLCNGGELFDWLNYVDGGGESRRNVQTLREAIAHCGLGLTAVRQIVAADGSDRRVDERLFTAGTLDGAGRTHNRVLAVPFDSRIVLTADGHTTRCSRVIGAPLGSEPLIVRVGNVTIGQLLPVDGKLAGDIAFSIPGVVAAINRPAGSTEAIAIDVYRGAVQVPGCSDSNGNGLSVSADETLLYTLTLEALQPLEVSLTLPETLNGAATLTVQARNPNTGVPAAGATVSFTTSGGSVISGGVTNDQGQLSATLMPVFGEPSVSVTAEVVAADGATGRATASAAVQLPRRWAGTITLAQTFRRVIDGVEREVREFSAERDVQVELAAGQQDAFFAVLSQSGSATQVETINEESCVITVRRSGLVSNPKFTQEVSPQLTLVPSGRHRISFGSLRVSGSGTGTSTCGPPGEFLVLPQTLETANQAEPQQFVDLDGGLMRGSETRIVRTGLPGSTSFNETTRTVTWSLAPN